ncbi:MAG: hypothetical protein AB1758_08355, partial [Candidatus Eremiobacterota bacterium]
MFYWEGLFRYLLLLIRWSVQCGATRIQLTPRHNRLRLEHDGAFHPEHPLMSQAVGLVGASCHQIALWGDSSEPRMLLPGAPGEVARGALPVGIEVQQKLGALGWLSSLLGSHQLAFQETRLVQVDARFCPVPILLKGQVLNDHDWLGLPSVLELTGQVLPHRDPIGLLLVPGRGLRVRVRNPAITRLPGQSSLPSMGTVLDCRMALGHYPPLTPRSHVYFLQDGVIVGEGYPDLGLPGLVAYLDAPGLRLLQGGYGVRPDAAWSELLEAVGRVARGWLGRPDHRLSPPVAETPPELPPPEAVPSAPASMASLLEELRSEGTLDSSGTFRIDFMRARAKLARYQLGLPHLYLTWMLQSAVAAGSDRVSAASHGREVVLECRVDLVPEDLPDRLASIILSDSLDSHLQPLAIGLNTVLGLHPERLELESPAGRRLIFQDGSIRVHQSPPSGVTRIRVLHRDGTGPRALEALRQRAGLCPVPVTVQGAPVPPPRTEALLGEFRLRSCSPGVLRPQPTSAHFRLSQEFGPDPVRADSLPWLDPTRTGIINRQF